ncbi:MAG: hypothetical protein Q9O74_03445 [Planctomycetota bacterium]|nr:hypothetical protein [Planctomycetota bacterium]
MKSEGDRPEDRLTDILDQAQQLTAILVTCVKNAKATRNSR